MVSESSAEVYQEIFAGVSSRSDLALRDCQGGAAVTRGDGKGRQLRGDRGACAEPEGDRSRGAGLGVCAWRKRRARIGQRRGRYANWRAGRRRRRGRAALQWVFAYLAQARGGGTRSRRRGAVRRGRDRTQGAAGGRTGDSGAGDTGGDRSHPRCAGQWIGQAGPAVCKSTPGREGLGHVSR